MAAIGTAAALAALLWVAWPSTTPVAVSRVPAPQTAPLPPDRPDASGALVSESESGATAPAGLASSNERDTGDAAYGAGDLAAAEAAFREALQHDPGDLDVRHTLAQVLTRRGEVALAVDEYDLLVAAEPGRWAFRVSRARALAMLERWPEAIAEYKMAVELSPDDSATHYHLGLALARTDEHAAAASTFERAVVLAPGELGVLVPLGAEYVALGRYDDARTVFGRYLTEAPDSADAAAVRELADGLGRALSAGGAPPQALPKRLTDAARRLSDR